MKSYTFHKSHDGRHRAALRDLNALEAVYLEDLAQGSVVLKMATIATSFRAIIGKTIVTMYHDKYGNIILRYEDYGNN